MSNLNVNFTGLHPRSVPLNELERPQQALLGEQPLKASGKYQLLVDNSARSVDHALSDAELTAALSPAGLIVSNTDNTPANFINLTITPAQLLSVAGLDDTVNSAAKLTIVRAGLLGPPVQVNGVAVILTTKALAHAVINGLGTVVV